MGGLKILFLESNPQNHGNTLTCSMATGCHVEQLKATMWTFYKAYVALVLISCVAVESFV